MPGQDRLYHLINELGLLADEPKPNPFAVLGLDRSFAHDLLNTDESGNLLRSTVGGLYLRLTRFFHPDVEATREDRFVELREAYERVRDAEPSKLQLWAKAETPVGSAVSKKQQEQRALVVRRAAELVRQNIELGQDPNHFSQFPWAQGVLLRRGRATFLARQTPTGLEVRPGRGLVLDVARTPDSPSPQALDVQLFMHDHGSFGLAPDSEVTVYRDETDRTTVLGADLGFIMDISDAVTQYGKARYEDVESTAWSRTKDPLLLRTQVLGPASSGRSKAEVTTFPGREDGGRGRKVAWNVSLEVGGSLDQLDFFKKVRNTAGALALSGSGTQRQANYFGLVAVPTIELIHRDAGYSPLVVPESTLLLYDSQNRMPVVTDAQVIGMIGNGPQYDRTGS